MGAVLNFSVQMEDVGGCPTCGIPVVLTSNMARARREDKKTFFCPSGHAQSFTATRVAELEAEVERLKTTIGWRDKQIENRDKSLSAMKGQITKIKNRVGNGVCPCCNRTFQNLMRHMQTKHPQYRDEGAES